MFNNYMYNYYKCNDNMFYVRLMNSKVKYDERQ